MEWQYLTGMQPQPEKAKTSSHNREKNLNFKIKTLRTNYVKTRFPQFGKEDQV